jgi:hypothetical protein
MNSQDITYRLSLVVGDILVEYISSDSYWAIDRGVSPKIFTNYIIEEALRNNYLYKIKRFNGTK